MGDLRNQLQKSVNERGQLIGITLSVAQTPSTPPPSTCGYLIGSSLFQGPHPNFQNYYLANPSSFSKNCLNFHLTLAGHETENKHTWALFLPLPSEGARKAERDPPVMAPTDFPRCGEGALVAGHEWLRPFKDLGSPSLTRTVDNTSQTNIWHVVAVGGHPPVGTLPGDR